MKESVVTMIRQLRLSGLLASLEVRLQEARASRLSHEEFLELVLQDEILVRQDRQRNRRLKTAGFREQKLLEDFDFRFNTSVSRKQMHDLAAVHFVREHRDVLFLGPPGVGKPQPT